MLFLGCTSVFTTETDRIFLKASPWELEKKNQCGNSASLLVLLGLHHSYSRAKLRRDPAPQEQLFQQSSGDSQHEGYVQEIPSTREVCRSFTTKEACGAWKCSGEMFCSKTKHRRRAGFQQTQLSTGILQLLPELPGGSSGAEAAAEPQRPELRLLPPTQLRQEGSPDIHHHFLRLLSGIHWAVAFKWEGQKCRRGTFCEIPAKPPAATAISVALFVEHLSSCWTCTLRNYSFCMVISWS